MLASYRRRARPLRVAILPGKDAGHPVTAAIGAVSTVPGDGRRAFGGRPADTSSHIGLLLSLRSAPHTDALAQDRAYHLPRGA